MFILIGTSLQARDGLADGGYPSHMCLHERLFMHATLANIRSSKIQLHRKVANLFHVS